MIITVLNGGQWIDSCMESIIKQTAVQSQQIQQLQATTHKLHSGEAQNPFMSTMTNSPNTILACDATTTTTNNIATSNLHDLAPIIEVCVFDDCSNDNTLKILNKWRIHLREHFNINMHIVENKTGKSRGGNL